ncbi:MAG: AAA family ATPase [Emticicia sp.]
MQEEIKYITKVEIKKLWGYEDLNFVWNLNPDVNILAGDNGSGKSTIMNLIEVAFSRNEEIETLEKAESTKIEFNNGNSISTQLINKQPTWEFRNPAQLDEIKYSFSLINTFEQPFLSSIIVKNLTTNEVKSFLDMIIFGLQKKYLDYQITIGNRAIDILQKGENNIIKVSAKKTLFLDTIDALFSHTQKKIDRTKNEISFIQRGEKEISPYQLSSGEKQMLIILLTTLVQDEKHSIMIMDEPEISLHPDWQENLIDNIRKLNENVQIIIATHSPSIVINGWKDKVFEMSEIQTKN